MDNSQSRQLSYPSLQKSDITRLISYVKCNQKNIRIKSFLEKKPFSRTAHSPSKSPSFTTYFSPSQNPRFQPPSINSTLGTFKHEQNSSSVPFLHRSVRTKLEEVNKNELFMEGISDLAVRTKNSEGTTEGGGRVRSRVSRNLGVGREGVLGRRNKTLQLSKFLRKKIIRNRRKVAVSKLTSPVHNDSKMNIEEQKNPRVLRQSSLSLQIRSRNFKSSERIKQAHTQLQQLESKIFTRMMSPNPSQLKLKDKLAELNEEMKRTAMNNSRAIQNFSITLSNNKNKVVFLDSMKVGYYKVFIQRAKTPLVFTIESTSTEITTCVSFSTHFPDIDNNCGIYEPGKIKIKAINDQKIFHEEFLYLSILNMGYKRAKVKLVFKAQKKNDNSFSSIADMLGENDLWTNIREQQKQRLYNTKDKITKKLDEILSHPNNFIEFSDCLDGICERKNKESIQKYNSNESKLRKVQKYLSPLKNSGMQEYEYKYKRSVENKAKIEEWDHKRKVFMLHKKEYKKSYLRKLSAEKAINDEKQGVARGWLLYFQLKRIMAAQLKKYRSKKAVRLRDEAVIAMKDNKNQMVDRISRCFFRFVGVKNKMFDGRIQRSIAFSSKFVALSIQNNVRFEAKMTILNFFRNREEASKFYSKAIKYRNQVLKIRDRWKKKMDETIKKYNILDAIWNKEVGNLIQFLKDVNNPTPAQKKMMKKLKKIPEELKDMALYLYYEKCKNKHSIEFFSWLEKYRSNAKELVFKYVKRFNDQINKENDKADENSEEEIEEEEEVEGETSPPDRSPSKMLEKVRNLATPTNAYLRLLKPEIQDLDMIGINLNSTTLKKKKVNQVKMKIFEGLEVSKDIIIPPSDPQDDKDTFVAPKLKYIPTADLMREQIIRACYVKNHKKFIKDNTYEKYDIMKDFGFTS
ncbi:unnamed protein product [Moneuplotes crassus]|uniref:Uncharacterized protein n=1 Tax=Euplotes crassus TaxID=5936 RepID=A0AAD1XFU7_EUPCR|nr:unnamed protein product [Moneuplotes crassus]